jgi:hypothetical protein
VTIGYRHGANDASRRGRDVNSPVHVNPWARGGSMSTDWTDVPVPTRTVERASSSGPRRGPRAFDAVVVVIAAAATAGVIAGASLRPWRTAPPEPAVAVGDLQAAVSPLRADGVGRADGRSGLLPVGTSADTVVGSITWSRVEGDAMSLPARVTGGSDSGLFGDDEDGRRWRSRDGGRTWVGDDVFDVQRRVGGVTWIVHHEGDRATLMRSTPNGAVAVDFAGENVMGSGFTISTELAVADGFPIEIEGAFYVLANRRARLPWERVAGVTAGQPYRVEVDVDDGAFVVISGGDVEQMPVTELALQPVGATGRFDLMEGNVIAWTFDTSAGDLGVSAIDVVAGAWTASWLRWDGNTFVPEATPWSPDDRVGVVATPGGVLARSLSAPDRQAALWHTSDGRNWEAVQLPAPPAANTPLDIYQGAGDAIVTAFTDAGLTSWSTVDGHRFDELPDVSGIAARTRGSFGWVAPNARSAPRVHVSADGVDWELVDLRSLLDLDDSRWDVAIDVRAIDSAIYVTVTRPSGRTLLIGDVKPTR